jgi:hypothetical protein
MSNYFSLLRFFSDFFVLLPAFLCVKLLLPLSVVSQKIQEEGFYLAFSQEGFFYCNKGGKPLRRKT